VIDPYNDFIAEGGKLWERLKGVAEANNCIPHMTAVLNTARRAQLRVFYALHRRYRPGDYETWKYIAPIQKAAWSRKTFEYGTWGGEIRSEFVPQEGDVVALEHWCSSGFANTDLDLQLKRHGIERLIVIGLIAHTCVEATVRLLRNSATTSRWSAMRRRTIPTVPCTLRSTSTCRTTPPS
jgi:ureidoacrylate peracid hydrolase